MTFSNAQRLAVANEAEVIGLGHHPYAFGGAGPTTYDCSGVAVAAWKTVKLTLPHSSEDLAERFGIAKPTNTNELRLLPGDLVFYYGTTPSKVTHVAVFLRRQAGLYVVAQATDEEHGSEVIKMRKYVDPTGFGFIR